MKQTNITIGLVENDFNFASQTISILKQTSGIDQIFHWESSETFWRDDNSKNLDIVFLDIMLPGMSGVELAGMISERNPDIQKIMLILDHQSLTASRQS